MKKIRLLFTAVCLSLLLEPVLGVVRAEVSAPVFRGATSYIDLGAPDALQISNNTPFTVETWVRVEFHRSEAWFYSKNNARTTPRSYVLGLREYGTKMSALHNGNTWREVVLPAPIAVGSWHHLAYSFDGTNMTFVFDGIQVGNKLSYSFQNDVNHTVKIGGFQDNTDLWGNIADVRVWDHARNPLEIQSAMNRRLNGTEEGLLGYWPLNEGSGTTVFDRTVHANNGSRIGASDWISADNLDLAVFALAHPVTGSTRFTSTNAVAIPRLFIPNGCDHYQMTLSGDAASIDPDGWIATNTPPDLKEFPRPVADTNITVYAWYTNSTDAAYVVQSDVASIYYTTALPIPSVRTAVSREKILDRSVIIQGTDLDDGSTGGQTVDGTEIGIYTWTALVEDPDEDLTPDETQATLAGSGPYALKLMLMNEAGCVITSTVSSTLTLSSYSGYNVWTGNGLTDLWSDGGNWNAGVPEAGQNVVINSATATPLLEGSTAELASFSMTAGTLTFNEWDSRLSATDVTISGGTVTTSGGFANYGSSNRVWIAAANNFTLTDPAKIDVSGKGYLPMTGHEIGVLGGYGCGGGHGGRGGTAYARGGGVYDSLTAPTMAGSGGFYGANHIGGTGGGVVKIEAGGTVAINGIIAANGGNGVSQQGGGAAGGSIYITTSNFTGNTKGKLQVNGGNEVWGHYGGGGGGGRIAVTGGVVDHSLGVQFSASPGKSRYDMNDGKVLSDRGMPTYLEPFQAWIPQWGTLYIEDNSFLEVPPPDNTLFDVILHVGTVKEWAISALMLTKNRFRLAPEGFTLKVAGDLMVGGTAHLGVEGSIYVGNDILLAGSGRLSVYAGPTNGIDCAYGAVVAVTNDIVIADNAWLQPVTQPTNGGSVLLRMRDLKVTGELAGINASGRGFAGCWGPGHGSANSARGGGGSYGGKGADGSSGPSIIYGNPYAPLLPGSGGGSGTDRAPFFAGSGYGGGLIRVEAARDVNLSGQIVADGCSGCTHYIYGSGGSGGGILISCNRFFGTETALLSARGGYNGGENSGSGGGGRIAIWHKRMPAYLQAKLLSGVTGTAIVSTEKPASYLGQVNVAGGVGGTNAAKWGEAGTIWFVMPPPSGTIIVVR